MSSLPALTDATFDATIAGEARTVIVDFWAEWCPPCRAVEPVLEQLAAAHTGTLAVYKLNADENTQATMKYQALSLPTMKVFRDGALVTTIVGAKPRAALEAALAPFLR